MKLRPFTNFQETDIIGYNHWCLGCNGSHSIWTKQKNSRGATWTFDGNFEKPTFSPSIKITYNGKDAGIDGWPHTCCHYFIEAGKIRYLNDCTHNFAGKLIDLPEWPQRY